MQNDEEAQNVRNTQRTDQDSAGQSNRASRRPSNVNTTAAQQANVPSPRRSARIAGQDPTSAGLPGSPRGTRGSSTPKNLPGSASHTASRNLPGSATRTAHNPEPATSQAPPTGASSPQQSRAQARYTPRPADSTQSDQAATNAPSAANVPSDGSQSNPVQNYRATVEDADLSEDSNSTTRASQSGQSSTATPANGASQGQSGRGTAASAAAQSTESPATASSSHGFIPIVRDTGDDVSMPDRSASGSPPTSEANRFSPGAASTASANGFRAVSRRELATGKAHFKYTSRGAQSSITCDVINYQNWGHGARLMLRAENRSSHYLLCRASRLGPGALQEYRSYSGSSQVEITPGGSLTDKSHDHISIGAVASLFSQHFMPTENAQVPWANEPYHLVLVSFDEGVSEHWYKYTDLKRRWHIITEDIEEFLGYSDEDRSTVQLTPPSTRPGSAQAHHPRGSAQNANGAGMEGARTENAGANGQMPDNIADLLKNIQTMMASFTTRISALERSTNARRAAAREIDQDGIMFEHYGLHRMMGHERPMDATCPVCTNSFEDGTVNPLGYDNCSHAVCETCTRTIISQHRENALCPMCRASLLRRD